MIVVCDRINKKNLHNVTVYINNIMMFENAYEYLLKIYFCIGFSHLKQQTHTNYLHICGWNILINNLMKLALKTLNVGKHNY